MSTGAPGPPHVVVVGGGIAGLSAAWFLAQRGAGRVRVTVLESAGEVGGKLRVSEVAGIPVDEGAESMLMRRPEAVTLAHDVGLGPDVVHPAVRGASVWIGDHLRPLPSGQLMGIPSDLRALAAARILSLSALARIPLDFVLPRTPVTGDISVGRYVEARLGREVVDRLVEPVLGGVYAGHAHEISLDAALPQLSGAARVERSLLKGARQALDETRLGPQRPVFASVRGGLGRLPDVVAQASGAHVRTGVTVRELRRSPGGWRLVLGETRSPEALHADAVVLAVPAPSARRLLADVSATAAAELAMIDYASVAVVTLAFPRAAIAHRLQGTGFLVPPSEQRMIKAATYSSSKWAWLADADPDVMLVRCSIGRHREEADLQRDDEDLVWIAQAELEAATDIRDAPLDSRVSRWGGSLPQYAVGHVERVGRIRRAVAAHDGLAVCGAAYDGVGIPACIASAEAAVDRVLRDVADARQWSHG